MDKRDFRCVLKVNAKTLADNAVILRKISGKKLICVLKADAYGHGAVKAARCLEEYADMFAVASPAEAAALKNAKINVPVLILGSITAREHSVAAAYDGIAVAVSSLREAAAANYEASLRGRAISVHIALDCGMRRFGFPCGSRAVRLVSSMRNISVDGIYTHYPCADTDAALTEKQRDIFSREVAELEDAGFSFGYVHAQNSAAVLGGCGAVGNAVRCGIALYGADPACAAYGLKPAAEFMAQILAIRTLKSGEKIGYGLSYESAYSASVAIVAAGYADGLPYGTDVPLRAFVRGVSCPVVGKICMDVCFVEVSDVSGVKEGDYAVFFGESACSVSEVAANARTIPYEILCRINRRVRRIYVSDKE